MSSRVYSSAVTLENKNTETAKYFFAAFEALDLEVLFSLITEDYTWEVVGNKKLMSGAGFHGKEVLTAVGSGTVFENIVVTVQDSIAQGNKVALDVRMVADVLATGLVYDNRMVMIFRFRNGKIYSMSEHVDTATTLAATQPGRINTDF
eukprot:CAMPEP_0170536428 /NCGR_PEP_ID=MMETSP0209-20121228/102144_1 /TAXON_ID=665100 ORGANISM="Litonotus pictus, Strain P1" /NCGR_SAMPLE_ID=MMETSP0209 /ASSEMBLY_ACC=CAM_ASM_000301 /LENGTH=148 /DNA_ID=CAMNT_0010837793 /DNA_START=42 /DNA_END=488 /DNA_ORIENTATION=+